MEGMSIFHNLEEIAERPEPFAFCTTNDLWTDEHISRKMLSYHLNEKIDVSSRNIDFINRSVEWIASHFNVDSHTRIVDFGCGPGLYASRLAELGASVTGIDFSVRSVEYARAEAERKGLSIRYINQNYLDFKTAENFDLVLMIMCDFCALSPARRRTMLMKFHSILAPEGAVLLDVYSHAAYNQREETSIFGENLQNGFWSAEKYFGFLQTFKYDDARVVLDKYTIVEADRKRTFYNWLQYFSPEELKSEFSEAGFRKFDLYGNVAGEPFHESSPEFAAVGTR